MRNIKKFLKEETAAAQMVEAAIIYPVVFLIIFMMIYMGLYILQSISVGAYAQKIAMLASREVSSPGYYLLIDGDKISTGAVELDSNNVPSPDFSKLYGDEFNRTDGSVVYRYWRGKNALNENGQETYANALKTMMQEKSVIVPDTASGALSVTVSCDNNFITQYY